jgi:hypothetical protein
VRGTILILTSTACLLAFIGVAHATLTASSSVGSNNITLDTLNPPTSLNATGGPSVNLSWTATTDTYASGYHVLRGTASGGPYSQIANVTPRTTTTHIDNPGGGAFYYVVRSYFHNWESVDSDQASATTGSTGYLNCSANAAVTTASGDNNGFQLNPGNACADDAAFAQDTNSGTNTTLACANTGKDRHLYYNYNVSIPAGSTIDGIELRLDAWADATAGAPSMCVELSWNGGATWTAVKTTPNLTATQATYTLGSATDTWGRTWATTDFTNANFRVRITDVNSNNNRDHRLDWVTLRVAYTPP